MKDRILGCLLLKYTADWLTAEEMEEYKYSSERIIAVQNVKLGNSPASA